jgi:hypothetical protein
LPPHRPATLLLFEPARVDHLERVYDHLDRKTDALLAHRSQWRSTMGIDDGDGEKQREQREAFVTRVHDEARIAGGSPPPKRCPARRSKSRRAEARRTGSTNRP